MFLLIKNGDIFTPHAIGKNDILTCAGKIIKIAKNIPEPDGYLTEVIDATGMSVTPGFIDSHMHLIGAGGSGGPESRSRCIPLSTIARAGVTTAIGMLGLDSVGFSPRDLYFRAQALEREGLSAFILTGSYALPSVTITGSVATDIVLIDKAVGLKIAMREAASESPSKEQLRQIIVEVMRAGRWSGKAGVVVAHQGDLVESLDWVCTMMEEQMIPMRHFVATHINRSPEVFEDAIACGKRGMILDLTGNIPYKPESIPASKAFRLMLEAGVPIENITFTSDAGPYLVVDGKDVILPVDICARELQLMVKKEKLSLSDALAPLTTNPARIYSLDSTKGSLEPGKDADILLLDDNLNVDIVVAKGKTLVKAGKPVVRDRMEELHNNMLK